MHQNTIFLSPPDIFNKNIASELDVVVIGKRSGHLWEQTDLPQYLSRQNHPPLFNPSNTGPLLYRNNFLTLHDLAYYHHPEWNSRLFSLWYNFLVPQLVKRSRHLFTVSNTIKDEVVKYYKAPSSHISVTYNGISQEMLASGGQNGAAKKKIILSVGSFNKRKNHHALVNAFVASDLKKDYQLVLIGDKNKVFRESNLDEATLAAGNIVILQNVGGEDLIRLYREAEVLVSLSMYEGFGIPLLEGLFYNCKIVCSDIPVYRELFSQYASFCNPHDIHEIRKTLENAVSDNSRQLKLPLPEQFSYAASAEVIVDNILRHSLAK